MSVKKTPIYLLDRQIIKPIKWVNQKYKVGSLPVNSVEERLILKLDPINGKTYDSGGLGTTGQPFYDIKSTIDFINEYQIQRYIELDGQSKTFNVLDLIILNNYDYIKLSNCVINLNFDLYSKAPQIPGQSYLNFISNKITILENVSIFLNHSLSAHYDREAILFFSKTKVWLKNVKINNTDVSFYIFNGMRFQSCEIHINNIQILAKDDVATNSVATNGLLIEDGSTMTTWGDQGIAKIKARSNGIITENSQILSTIDNSLIDAANNETISTGTTETVHSISKVYTGDLVDHTNGELNLVGFTATPNANQLFVFINGMYYEENYGYTISQDGTKLIFDSGIYSNLTANDIIIIKKIF